MYKFIFIGVRCYMSRVCHQRTSSHHPMLRHLSHISIKNYTFFQKTKRAPYFKSKKNNVQSYTSKQIKTLLMWEKVQLLELDIVRKMSNNYITTKYKKYSLT